jgi:hypothetical protein
MEFKRRQVHVPCELLSLQLQSTRGRNHQLRPTLHPTASATPQEIISSSHCTPSNQVQSPAVSILSSTSRISLSTWIHCTCTESSQVVVNINDQLPAPHSHYKNTSENPLHEAENFQQLIHQLIFNN